MPPKSSKKKGSSAAPVFDGLTLCVSGSFSRSQGELKDLLESNGATLAATPNKSCDYLVSDSLGSAKTAKAQKDGMPIVTEEWVDACIKAGKVVTTAKFFLANGAADSKSSSTSTKSKAKASSTKGKGKAKKDADEDVEMEEEEEEAAPATKAKGKVTKAATSKKASSTKAAGKGKRKAKADEEEEVEEEEEEEEAASAPAKKKQKAATGAKAKPAKTTAASKKKGKGKKAAAEEEDEDAMDEEESDSSAAVVPASSPVAVAVAAASTAVVVAGAAAKAAAAAPVARKPDRDLPGRDSYSIVDDYAVLLNQTNITGGRNNNKFYVIQLVRSAGGAHYVWTRWGRVGEPGQHKLDPCGSLESAIKAFESKFRDKTKNAWQDRANFKKHKDKYELVEVEEGGDGDGDSPLGRLTQSQIEKGQAVLASLRQILESGSGAGIGELSARYYTLIPTVVGRQVAPAINNLPMLTEKEELLKFMLRMGFDDVSGDEAGLSPIDGIVDLPLPTSLTEAARGVCSSSDIKSADSRGADLAKKQAGKPQRKMDAHLYAAIMLYTSNAIYAALNAALREEKRAKVRQYFRYLRLFLEALGTLPQMNRTLWRGLSVDLSSNPQYAEGSTLTWWGVSSCTSDLQVARNFMHSCGGQTTLLTIQAKTAADISEITFFPHEKESLLAPGTKLKVLSNKKNGNVTEITVEEVGQAFVMPAA